ncbi:MAG: hypothetical protein U9M98_00955 [Patescibacteria group bacterium]|nr:hypothetical protein [Patescibacteria group bacterium]
MEKEKANIIKIITLSIPIAIFAYFLGTLTVKLSTTPQYIFLLLTNPLEIAKLFFCLLLLSAFSIPALSISYKNRNNLYLSLGIIVTGFALPQLSLSSQSIILLTLSSSLFLGALLLLQYNLHGKIENTVKIRKGFRFQPQIRQFYLLIALIISLSFAIIHTLNLQKNATTIEVPEKMLGERFESQLGIQDQKEILEFLRQESMESLSEGSTRQELGFSPEKLKLEEIKITEEGNLDLSKALPDATEPLQRKIEAELAKHQQKIVFFLAALLFLIIHFLSRFALIFSPILTSLLLAFLRKTKLIQIATKQVESEYFIL